MENVRAYITKTTIAIAIILLCALVLRLYRLNTYDLWFDEQNTDLYTSENLIRAADLSGEKRLPLMLTNLKNDPHSSFYYLLVYLYSVLFGDGKSLRVLSVLFSLLSLGVFYKLSRVFFNRAVSLYALLIMAFNPFHIYYAQEARAYATASFFALLMVYLFMQALKTGKRFYWVCFPIASFFAIFADYFSAMLFVVSGLVLLFRRNRRYIEKWVLSLFAILIFFMFFQYILINQLRFVKGSFWLLAPSWSMLVFTWKFFSLGYSATGIQYQIGLSVFMVLFCCGAYSSYRSDKTNTLILLLFLFLPIMATFIVSKFGTPVYIHRQLIVFSPFFYLFLAKGTESIANKRVQIAAMICVVTLMTASLANYYRGWMFSHENQPGLFPGVLPKRSYGDLMAYLGREYKEGDLIAAADIQSYLMAFLHIIRNHEQYNYTPSEMFCFIAYPVALHPFDAQYLRIRELAETRIPAEEWKKTHIFSFFQNGGIGMDKIRLDNDNIKRIWLITSNWIKGTPFPTNAIMMRDYMSENFDKVLSKGKDGIRVELYTKKMN